MAAAPTVVPKSPAIWGRSESVTRTWAWLAKPATASRTIDRVGFGWVSGVEMGTKISAGSFGGAGQRVPAKRGPTVNSTREPGIHNHSWSESQPPGLDRKSV